MGCGRSTGDRQLTAAPLSQPDGFVGLACQRRLRALASGDCREIWPCDGLVTYWWLRQKASYWPPAPALRRLHKAPPSPSCSPSLTSLALLPPVDPARCA